MGAVQGALCVDITKHFVEITIDDRTSDDAIREEKA